MLWKLLSDDNLTPQHVLQLIQEADPGLEVVEKSADLLWISSESNNNEYGQFLLVKSKSMNLLVYYLLESRLSQLKPTVSILDILVLNDDLKAIDSYHTVIDSLV